SVSGIQQKFFKAQRKTSNSSQRASGGQRPAIGIRRSVLTLSWLLGVSTLSPILTPVASFADQDIMGENGSSFMEEV
ncbi:hypothetical protein ABTE98_20065, partial [Acinetobacter baumannii]